MRIARSPEVFKNQEIEVLKEVLDDLLHNHQTGYYLFEEKQDENAVGFVIFGKTPLTEFGWDIYWMAVERSCQGRGVGRKLLRRVEEFILDRQPRAILRVETSSRKEYVHARNLYGKQGFQVTGRIPNFYSPGDDLIVFHKEVKNQTAVAAVPAAAPAIPAAAAVSAAIPAIPAAIPVPVGSRNA